jgi:uncharacterized membrane protein YeiB
MGNRALLKLAWNMLFLLILGLALQSLPHGRWVILQHFSALFAVALLISRLGPKALLTIASVSLALGPVIYLKGLIEQPETYDQSVVVINDGFAGVIHGLVFSGPYPLITYLAPFAFGMWLGRQDLSSKNLQFRLVFWGTSVAVITEFATRALDGSLFLPGGQPDWGWLILKQPHGQMPLWLLGSIASSIFVLGVCLLLSSRFPRACQPLAIFGQLALTIYVTHLLGFVLLGEGFRLQSLGLASLASVGAIVCFAVFSWYWRRFFPRGPLELLMNLPWRFIRLK